MRRLETVQGRVVRPSLWGPPLQARSLPFSWSKNADWRLESSFDRWYGRQGKPEGLRVKTAEQLLNLFSAEVASLGGRPTDRYELLALGQHYGLPTRLLLVVLQQSARAGEDDAVEMRTRKPTERRQNRTWISTSARRRNPPIFSRLILCTHSFIARDGTC